MQNRGKKILHVWIKHICGGAIDEKEKELTQDIQAWYLLMG